MIIKNYIPLSKHLGQREDFNLSIKDLHGKYIDANEIGMQTLGISLVEKIIGQTDYDLFPDAQASIMHNNDREIIQIDRPKMFFEKGDSVFGANSIFRSYKMPFRLLSKKILGVVCISSIMTIQAKFPQRKLLLSQRQKECLHLMIMGMTFKQIANELNLSPKTVEHYIDAIKNKFGCNTRHEIIKKGMELGFLFN